jgi:dolichyl-diphosphooligosaccharide--protein glycosyltransferase
VAWITTFQAFTPGLLFVASLGVVGIAEGADRFGYSTRTTALVEIGAGVVGVGLLWIAVPPLAETILGFQRMLQNYGAGSIAETYSLVSQELGTVVGPIFVFGLVLFLSLPYLLVASYRTYREHRPALAIGVLYAWYFLVLTGLQIRFAGQLSHFVALFGGIGFVHLAERVDLLEDVSIVGSLESGAEVAIPSKTTVLYLGVLFLLIGGLGIVQSAVKMNQITVDDSTYETATWIGEYNRQAALVYPHSKVFSHWGQNRVYNYFANGRSHSYYFAQEYYEGFVTGTDGEKWFKQIHSEVGLVVLEPVDGGSPARSIHHRLYHEFGSNDGKVPGLSRYRLVYTNPAGQRVFEVVNGAMLSGETTPNKAVLVETNVSVENHDFVYKRRTMADSNGEYTVRVPYKGTYELPDGRTITVTSEDIRSGAVVNPS